jgi:hypothetical protein
MYQVFDCGKPADCEHFKVRPSWNNSCFNTFEEAQAYALNWLGWIGEGLELKLGIPYNYGYDSRIEIRKIN